MYGNRDGPWAERARFVDGFPVLFDDHAVKTRIEQLVHRCDRTRIEGGARRESCAAETSSNLEYPE